MNGRGLLATAILAAWGAGLAALARRELTRSDVERLAEISIRVSPVASYYTVERAGRHAGFASFTTDTVPDGLQFTDYRVVDDSLAADGRRVAQVVTRASRSLVLREIAVRDGERTGLAVVVDDSVLRVVTSVGAASDTSHHVFRPPLLVPALLPMVTALGDAPSTGDQKTWSVFDPQTMSVREAVATIRAESTWVVIDSAAFDARASRWRGVHADTVRAWHVTEGTAATPHRLDAWVDETGQVVAQDRADRHERRNAYEVAFENWRSARRGGRAPVAAPGAGSGTMERLVVRLAGLPLDQLQVTNAWQHVTGDTVIVVAADPPRRASGYWIPPHRDHRTRFVRELQVEPYIEVEAPPIVAAARRVRGKEPDPATVARLLLRWVADSIADDATPTPPSAAAALRSRAGQAAHRVNLWVALARASGIPARPVLGVRVAPEGMSTMPWAEAWLGGEWVPVNVTAGLMPADASHLRLLVGPTALQPDLERLVSRSPPSLLSTTRR